MAKHLSALRADDVFICFYTLWAQRGYLGIHAEVPTAQYLHSASEVNGAPEINVHHEAA